MSPPHSANSPSGVCLTSPSIRSESRALSRCATSAAIRGPGGRGPLAEDPCSRVEQPSADLAIGSRVAPAPVAGVCRGVSGGSPDARTQRAYGNILGAGVHTVALSSIQARGKHWGRGVVGKQRCQCPRDRERLRVLPRVGAACTARATTLRTLVSTTGTRLS